MADSQKQIGRLLPLAQLLLDRELLSLGAIRARELTLQQQLSDLDKPLQPGNHSVQSIPPGQIALWQRWRQSKRKNLLAEHARIRADLEEAMETARRAFGRRQAVEEVLKKLKRRSKPR